MDTGKIDAASESEIVTRLRRDLSSANGRLEEMLREVAMVRSQIVYLESLLGVSRADVSVKRCDRPTIADSVERVLRASGKPMGATEIARAAIKAGILDVPSDRDGAGRVSAIVSQDIKYGTNRRFKRFGPGAIGLAEWSVDAVLDQAASAGGASGDGGIK